jgi:hypothetical protein
MLDRNKYTESAYIGEELFGDPVRERLHKCMVVEQTIADGDFSLEEALEAYQVGKEEYEEFVAKKSNFNIRASISGTTSMIYATPTYFDIFIKMIDDSVEEKFRQVLHQRLQRVKNELQHISKDIEELKEKA